LPSGVATMDETVWNGAGTVVIPTIGAAIGEPAAEPSNGASPKVKMPPSEATR
jgi:hypothetical protein